MIYLLKITGNLKLLGGTYIGQQTTIYAKITEIAKDHVPKRKEKTVLPKIGSQERKMH